MFAMKDLDSNFPVDNIKNVEEDGEDGFERNLKLLGVTALEDLLQDNVTDCIKDFRSA